MIKLFVGFLLRKIPRTFLQRTSRPIFKLISIFYLGNNVTCPICESNFRKFFPYGRKVRDNALCTNCLSLERHRLIYIYLSRKTSILSGNNKILHIAPEACLIKKFKENSNIDYITADLISPLADIKMDIHKMPFKDENFDFVMCNHVLEHVDDDIRALEEIKRVLKKGGEGIIQVPFYYPVPEKTIEDKSVIKGSDREKLYGQSDHLRKYGKDYDKRLSSNGLKVLKIKTQEFLTHDEILRYGLDPKEEIFIIRR